MKIDLAFEKKSTKLYNSFRTFEEAGYNMPYVAAILTKSIISDEFFNFTLGKYTFNEPSKNTNSSTFGKFIDPILYTLVIFSFCYLTGKWNFGWGVSV